MSDQPTVEVREDGRCPRCGSGLPPTVAMTPNGPEKRCANANCRMPWPEDPAEDEDPEPVPKQALRDLMQKAPPLPARKVPAAQAAPKDILGLARQRLAEVKAELRRLDALQRERAELERMIAAARKVAG